MTYLTRRIFFKLTLVLAGLLLLWPWLRRRQERGARSSAPAASDRSLPLGVDADGLSRVYLVRNGTPEQNVHKALAMMGGIATLIGPTDIVVVKPNAQRFNQGMTNTDAIKGFIDLVLGLPGFAGEVILAENHQYQQDDCCGWNTDQPNGRFNLNQLVAHYQQNGHPNVTKYHWHVAGPCTYPLEGNGQGNRRVRGPEEGDGYVWREDSYYLSPTGRKCLMTYPVFTSAYSGIRIDLKNGAWQDGRYLPERRVRFINFSALNHHGRYAGVTASVKNLMGVVDMTCGFPGDLYPETYNTHHIGVSRKKHWLFYGPWRLRAYRGWLRYRFEDFCYRNFHHTGGVLGCFMAQVRLPDLNIVAAELVGWGDRRKLEMAFRPRALLVSTDPVALDAVAAREVLLPGTPAAATEVAGVSLRKLHDPDDKDGPFYRFLREAQAQHVGNLDPHSIRVERSDGSAA